ncbi:GDSL-type esterase/lipase family protein (plasmid) [Enterococcus sp. 22-H-5-01]|uniref:GDSL-type esterase/lipase family protein n=1 Tax=Enterococcus sp. 22-H-5-01 TaxID=3418555 RepID=UPI003CFFE7A5
MYQLIWHQVFSNYHNLSFAPNNRTETLRIKQNLSGDGVRVEFSNRYDKESMKMKWAKVSTDPQMANAIFLTLNKEQAFAIPAGQSGWSDVAEINVPAKANIYIALEVMNEANNLATSAHSFSDQIFQTNIDDFSTNFVYGITSVALQTEKHGVTIGFFGDSLTNQGYYADAATISLYENLEGVSAINEGISGNRLLLPGTSQSEWKDSFGQSAVERFSHLVKYHPDAAVVLIGDNDLYQVGTDNQAEMPTAVQMITALQRIKNEATVSGILPIFVTLTPFKDALSGEKEAWSSEKETIRNQVNDWIREQKNRIDLDRFTKDVSDSRKLAPQFDSGDHLHFSISGGKLIGSFMAEQIIHLLKER